MKLSSLHESKPTIEYSPKARRARTTIQWPELNDKATEVNDEPEFKGYGELPSHDPWKHEVKPEKFQDRKRNRMLTRPLKPELDPLSGRAFDIVGTPLYGSPDQVADSSQDNPLYGELGPNPMFYSRSDPSRKGDLKRQVKSLEKVSGKKAYACRYPDGKTGVSTKPCPGKEIEL